MYKRQDQYRIAYDVELNYEPVDGELLKNDAILKGKNTVVKDCLLYTSRCV